MKTIVFLALPVLMFPVVLRTTFQSAPPKYMVEDGKPAGIGYEIFLYLRNSLKRYGIDLVWDGKFRNITEVQNLLSSCKIDFFIGISKTKERLEKFDFSRYPLYSLSYTMLLRKGVKNPKRIAVVGGTKTEKIFSRYFKNGKSKVIHAKSINHAVDFLNSGKVDAIFYNSMSLGYVYNQNPSRYSMSGYLSGRYYQFVAFSKCVPGDIKSIFNTAIFGLLRSGVIKAGILSLNLWDYMKPGNYLILASSDWPPYEFTIGDKWVGVDAEIVQRIFKKMGFEIYIEKMNRMRILESLKLGVIDGTFSIPIADDWKEFLHFSPEPIDMGVDGFLYRKDKYKESDLYVPANLVCGYVPGYAYEDILKSETSLQLVPVSNEETGVRALVFGRLDVLATNEFVGMYYAKKLGEASSLGFFPIFGPNYYYLALSKTDGYHEFILNTFSRELEKFKKTRSYKTLLKKYGLNYEELWTM